jgi:hypothetical protein
MPVGIAASCEGPASCPAMAFMDWASLAASFGASPSRHSCCSVCLVQLRLKNGERHRGNHAVEARQRAAKAVWRAASKSLKGMIRVLSLVSR